jgi:hypothetical protein
MAKKRRRKSTRPEILHRNALIRSFHPTVRFGVKGATPSPRSSAPVVEAAREVNGADPRHSRRGFKLWPDPNKRVGPAPPASVGYIMGVRPVVEVAADFASAHFDYLWSFALSGHLTHAFMVLTKSHYGSASVLT